MAATIETAPGCALYAHYRRYREQPVTARPARAALALAIRPVMGRCRPWGEAVTRRWG